MLYAAFVLALLNMAGMVSADNRMESVLAVTRCRANCLDQHSHLIRTEENCQKNSGCLMCWETCQMLHENFKIWGSMCSVPDICFPGCQTACNSLSYDNSLNEIDLTTLTINSVYDLSTLRVMLEWVPLEVQDMNDREGTVLYTVLFQDKTQDWHQVAQTTSHVIHIKGSLVGRGTSIRILAANATSLLSYAETTYMNSLVLGTKKAVYLNENSWSPQLVSLERDETSAGILATITWPNTPNEMGPHEYEVSWNVVDNTMITGHLLTSKNMAVITLWPDSIHLVTVDRYKTAGEVYDDSSQALVIDTKAPFSTKLPKPSDVLGKNDKVEFRTVIYYWIISFLVLIIVTIFVYSRMKGQVKEYQLKYSNQMSLLREKINLLRQLLQEQISNKLTRPVLSLSTEPKWDAKTIHQISETYHVV